MTRILHVLEALRGGTSRHVVDVIRSTPELQHHVVLPTAARRDLSSGAVVDVEAVARMRADGAAIHRVPMRRSTVHPANGVAVARIGRLIRAVRPDVVHGHSSVGGALARLAGLPLDRPVVYTPNGLATGAAPLRIERLLGRATTVLIAVSQSEADLAARLRLVPRERIRVVRNGIDLESSPAGDVVDLRVRLGLDPTTPLVGTVARLVAQKAPEDFVDVARRICAQRPDVHALLIGMGPEQAKVDRAVADSGVGDRFHQIAYLPRAADVLEQLDAFVLPSRFEGAPYTPLEAMRARVPVVLSDVVGNADVIEDGVSGRLCPMGDTEAMARAVGEILDDAPSRQAMVDAAAGRLAKEFDLHTMGMDLRDLYRDIAVDHPDPGRRTSSSNLDR